MKNKIIGLPLENLAHYMTIEDNKYSSLWETDYSAANWHKLANKVMKIFLPGTDIVDLGCGDGSAMRFFQKNGYPITGVDISAYAVNHLKDFNVYHSSLHDLTIFSTKQFTVGFCNDVIEHLPENLVKQALHEMARICKISLFISICPTPANHASPDGKNLHQTVHEAEWWESRLADIGVVHKYWMPFTRSLRYRVTLI